MTVIYGDSADNNIVGTSDADEIYGLNGNDTLYGSDGDDTLYGGAGNDLLDGGEDDDVLEGGAGADTLDGGSGNDTASYASSAGGVNVNLATGVGSNNDAQGDVFVSIENLTGSSFGDTLVGDGSANVLAGGRGNDSLSGGAGNDTLDGGDNDDVLVGGAGANLLDGGDGIDTANYTSSSQGVTVNLETGLGAGGDAAGDVLAGVENVIGSFYNDTLIGDDGANNLNGFDGRDTIVGGGGNDSVRGGLGNDLLIGGSGADFIDGGAPGSIDIDTASYADSKSGVTVDLRTGSGSGGDAQGDMLVHVENLIGSSHDDVLIGDAIANSTNVLDGGDGNDTIYGGGGSYDTLIGGNGDDVLYGEAVNTVMIGGAGADTFVGSASPDAYTTVSYVGSASGVRVDLAANTASRGDAEGDTLINVIDLIGSAHADVLIGNDADNILQAGGGNDYVFGGSGDDLLYGSYGQNAGSATLEGGTGADIIFGGGPVSTNYASYAGSSEGVTIDLVNEVGVGGDAQGDQLLGVLNVIGSANDDLLIGTELVNRLIGGAGNDTIVGGGNSDELDGGEGNDTVVYTGENQRLTINLVTGITNRANGPLDSILSFENAIGGEKSDIMIGTAGANLLAGGADADTLIGGAGADTLDGGSGIDTASYAGTSQGVRIDLVAGTGTGGDAQGDRLFGIENVIGSGGHDVLVGDGKNNWLVGGNGNDTLEGGDGADTLEGGGGTDTVSYASASAGVTVDLYRGEVVAGDGAAGSISGVEDAIGSAFDDRMFSTYAEGLLDGGAGDDLLAGGYMLQFTDPNGDPIYDPGPSGDTTLVGGAGSDTYLVARGGGNDTVIQAGIPDAADTTDTLHYDLGVSYDQLWFRQVGDDLVINVIGEELSSVSLDGWYSDPTRQVDVIEVSDGHRSLSASNVQMLVDAMSEFDMPPIGQTALDPLIAEQLAPVFASSWV
jgi:Ca2+-binding RTX toxin-like protein